MRILLDDVNGSGDIHFDVLNIICGHGKRGSSLDVMCCEGNSTRKLDFQKRVFVDIQYRKMDIKPNDIFVIGDVFTFLMHDECLYDVVFCMDGIEHLTKKDGGRLINLLQLSGEKVIFFTPLGEYCLIDDNDPDHHHSAWLPSEFEELGYSTIVFPKYHAEYNVGAFFAFKTDDTVHDTMRIHEEINKLPWIKK
jgi:hypothetical protein